MEGFAPYPIKPLFVLQALSEVIDWGHKIIGCEDAWNDVKGEGIKFGVIDTGVAIDHPDLTGAIGEYRDYTGSGIDDDRGHGTHVAGIIGARANGYGVIGVCPKSQINVYKIFSNNQPGNFVWFTQAVDQAVADGCHIINMSLGTKPEPPVMCYDAIKRARAAGCLIFAASGNSGAGKNPLAESDVDWPGRWPEVIAVGAIDTSQNKANFSSPGPEVEFAAPGMNVYSTWPPPNMYSVLSGTSMASPFAAGVAGLIWQKIRDKQGGDNVQIANKVVEIMRRAAKDIGPIGKDNMFGYGLVSIAEPVDGLALKSTPASCNLDAYIEDLSL